MDFGLVITLTVVLGTAFLLCALSSDRDGKRYGLRRMGEIWKGPIAIFALGAVLLVVVPFVLSRVSGGAIGGGLGWLFALLFMVGMYWIVDRINEKAEQPDIGSPENGRNTSEGAEDT